jgi:hypothetical protein
MVSAIHRMVHLGDSIRAAVAYVNGHSSRRKSKTKHVLTRSTVDRVFQSLPAHLRHPDTCSEAGLLDFIQQQQCESRAGQQHGSSLLTTLEEDILVEYIQFRHNSNASIGSEVIKAAAFRLLAKRDPPVQHTGTDSSHSALSGDCETEDEE